MRDRFSLRLLEIRMGFRPICQITTMEHRQIIGSVRSHGIFESASLVRSPVLKRGVPTMPRLRIRKSSGKSNVLALCCSAASIAFIFSSFDPAPAGEDLSIVQTAATTLTDVPFPPDAGIGFESELRGVAIEGVPATVQNGMLLNNHEAIKFSLLILQDGSRFLENVDAYTTVFNKQERINGDLSDVQTIEMKVRHEPSFSVYMKWKNGDTGRQVLFNEDYEDKKMVVKLGGLKGRLLPAIKLDPTSSRAMSESRYPVTEAGLLGMVKQMVAYRQTDIKNGHGVTCLRLPNRQWDERDCYCFQYNYDSPEINQTYRKSLVLIDTRYHIPLQVMNYTWTSETDGLTAEQIDELTLIENYSFSRTDFGRELVAEEFSRENPSYRM
jgi:hypothetical protein